MQVSGDLSLTIPHTTSLQLKIATLTALHARLQSLRQIPHALLRNGSIPRGVGVSELGEYVKNDAAVQEALRVAKESEKADGRDLKRRRRGAGEGDARKRQRQAAISTPLPITHTSTTTSSSLFPQCELPPLSLPALPAFIREWNKSHATKLAIWSPTRSQCNTNSNPLTLRFTAPDVLTAYLTLTYAGDSEDEQKALVIEGVNIFGSREKKPPHSQSQYDVFKILTEQMGIMMQSEPTVGVQTFVLLLQTYEEMFIETCPICARVLDKDTHVPAAVRVWVGGTDDNGEATLKVEGEEEKVGERRGKWEPRHLGCR